MQHRAYTVVQAPGRALIWGRAGYARQTKPYLPTMASLPYLPADAAPALRPACQNAPGLWHPPRPPNDLSQKAPAPAPAEHDDREYPPEHAHNASASRL